MNLFSRIIIKLSFSILLSLLCACVAPGNRLDTAMVRTAAHSSSDDGPCVVGGVDLAGALENFFHDAMCTLIEIPSDLPAEAYFLEESISFDFSGETEAGFGRAVEIRGMGAEQVELVAAAGQRHVTLSVADLLSGQALDLTLENLSLVATSAETNAGGVAAFVENAQLKLAFENVSVKNNVADEGGGIYVSSSAALEPSELFLKNV